MTRGAAAGVVLLLGSLVGAAPAGAGPDPTTGAADALATNEATPAGGQGTAAAPAGADATTLPLTGHGYGHGRGMGQYGAYGYAVDLGASRDAMLGWYYGGTVASSLGNPVINVVINAPLSTGYTGVTGPTIVYLAQGVLRTQAGTDTPIAAPDRAVKVERTGAATFQISDGPTCDGPWTPRTGTASTTWLRVLPAVADGALADTLKLCEGGSNARWLRGEIRAIDAGGRQYTVNSVAMDSYLRGVVPRESPASWGDAGGGRGMQALQVQAVAARSYAWSDSLIHRYPGFDATCDTVSCQVYGGRQRTWGSTVTESPQTDSAVAATAGLVRSDSGVVSRTEFSSSTGGYSAGGTFPAVPDDGDATGINPNHNWTSSLSISSIEAYYGKGTFVSATVKSRNGLGADGGRVLVLGLVFSGGSIDVSGDSFRSAFGLRSNWFSVSGGGPPPPPPAPVPEPAGGYTLQDDGTLVAFGRAPAAVPQASVPGLGRAVDTGGPSGRAGYMLDGWGGLHAFNGAPAPTGGPYWPGFDIANDVAVRDAGGGYVLDGYGAVHPFSGAPAPSSNPAGYSTTHGTDWAVRVAMRDASASGYVVFSDGHVEPFGGAPAVTSTALPSGRSVVGIVLGADQRSGLVVDSAGGLLPFAPGTPPPPGGGNLTGTIGADGRPDGSGYTSLVNGVVYPFGIATPASSTGTAPLRRDVTAIEEPAGYVLDAWGGLHPVGGTPAVTGAAYWPGRDVARRVVLRSDGAGYVMDLYGGLHPFGTVAVARPPDVTDGPYWPGWAIARDVVLIPGSSSGYVLDGWGGIHPFNGAPSVTGNAYWSGWDIARRLVVNPSGAGGYVLDGWGGLHPFTIPGRAAPPAATATGYSPQHDIYRDLVLTGDGRGYTVESSGALHPFGGASGTWSKAWSGDITGLSADNPARGTIVGLDLFGGIHTAPESAPTLVSTASWPGWPIARDVGLRPR
jgi:SpoIID/LytB domain protein